MFYILGKFCIGYVFIQQLLIPKFAICFINSGESDNYMGTHYCNSNAILRVANICQKLEAHDEIATQTVCKQKIVFCVVNSCFCKLVFSFSYHFKNIF